MILLDMKVMIKELFKKLKGIKNSDLFMNLSFYSLCVALALVPFSSYLLKRFVYIAILAQIVAKFIAVKKSKDKFFRPHFMNKMWIIFLIAMAVAVVFSNNRADSVSYFFERIMTYAGMFWVAKETVTTKSKLDFFCWTLVLTALVVGFDSLWQFFNGKDLFFAYPKSDGGRALTGPFGMHNFFSGYLEMLVPFTAVMVFRKLKLISRVICLVVAFLMFFSLVFDYQRATLLAAIISLLTALIIVNKKNILWVLILPLVALLALPQGFKERFARSFAIEKPAVLLAEQTELWTIPDNANVNQDLRYINVKQNRPVLKVLKPGWDNGRIALWLSALHLFRQSPVWGQGLNSYERFVNSHKELRLPSIHAHNTYLQLLAETGILGLFSFLMLLSVYFKKVIIFLIAKQENLRIFVIAASASIFTTVMLAMIATNMIAGLGFALIFWTLMAVSSNFVVGEVEVLSEQ